MVEFGPSDPKVPGSTLGHISFFFSFFASRISNSASFHILNNYILKAKQPFPFLFEQQKVPHK